MHDRDLETRRLFAEMMRSDDDRVKDILSFYIGTAYDQFFKPRPAIRRRAPRPPARKKAPRSRHPFQHYSLKELERVTTGELPKIIALVDDPEARLQMWTHLGQCGKCRGILAGLMVREPL